MQKLLNNNKYKLMNLQHSMASVIMKFMLSIA